MLTGLRSVPFTTGRAPMNCAARAILALSFHLLPTRTTPRAFNVRASSSPVSKGRLSALWAWTGRISPGSMWTPRGMGEALDGNYSAWACVSLVRRRGR